MARRTPTHVIDTLAVRQVISAMPADWIVRGLEERDYGIDLTIELYNGESPSGCLALIQVKGKKAAFRSPVKIGNFPTKTLHYAALFPHPFFIFHTSLTSEKTVFVWAQKYIEMQLSNKKSDWGTQGSNTIYFPEENVLETAQGQAKIERIMHWLPTQQSGLKFLADFEWLKLQWHSGDALSAGHLANCIRSVDSLCQHVLFLDHYAPEGHAVDLVELSDSLQALVPLVEANEDSSTIAFSELDAIVCEQIEALEALKMTFLSQSEMDHDELERTRIAAY